MKFNIVTKKIQIPTNVKKHLYSNMRKISRRLPFFNSDLPLLNFLVKKVSNKYYPKRHYHPSFTSTMDRKTSLAFFAGTINLQLAKNTVYLNFKGQTLSECLNRGVKLLERKLQKFKDLHFKSRSDYPNHSSIRKGYEYEK